MSHTGIGAVIPAAPRPVFEYDGKISQLYGVFLLNLLLTIITLGIFRFWAITRLRRYLWAHMRFEGTRLNYTGKGKELFFGFFLAMMILGIIFAGAAMVAAALAEIRPYLAAIPFAIAYIGLFILYGGAQFSAQRYRLSRTEWRGIRGGMVGSAPRYGVAWLLYLLLTIVTLYQAVPWMQVGLARRRINASRFGSAEFSFHGRAGRLYLCWLGTLLGYVLLLALIGGAVAAFEWTAIRQIFSGAGKGSGAEIALRRAIPVVVIGLIVFGIGSGLLATWYYARLVRLLTGETAMTVPGAHGPQTLRFSSSVNAGSLLWLFLTNLLIAVLTLGLGIPIVLHRSARYIARTTHMTGFLDAPALLQSTLARPGLGEGFLQALDPGIV